MKAQNYGKIINISSGSILIGNPVRVHYVTSKAGIIGLTRSLAKPFGEYNICVNSIMPGSTASEGILEAYPHEILERAAAQRSLKRIMQPEDLVGTVIFLASSDSDFMTGQAILVDGGAKMY
jgi:3-oxoacyl-[acyl-carrier protein] reductase